MTYHDANRVPPVDSVSYAFEGAENTPYSCMFWCLLTLTAGEDDAL